MSEHMEASADEILTAIREHGLEGVVGKRKESLYEVGKRTGSWTKHRVNLAQEFVIDGFMPGPDGLDSITFGYYATTEGMN
jgi:ATP-dependent DNA ligase